MTTHRLALAAIAVALLATGCKKQQQAQLYEPVPVARRDIVVSRPTARSSRSRSWT